MAKDLLEFIQAAQEIYRDNKGLRDWSLKNFPKVHPFSNEIVELTNNMIPIGKNLYRQKDGGDVFEIIDGRLQLVIDPNKKYFTE